MIPQIKVEPTKEPMNVGVDANWSGRFFVYGTGDGFWCSRAEAAELVRLLSLRLSETTPRPPNVWCVVLQDIGKLFTEWVHSAVPVDDRGNLDSKWARTFLFRANRWLSDIARTYGLEHQVAGWEIRIWEGATDEHGQPLRPFVVDKTITIIAVDPEGIGHEIAELASKGIV